jgi:hypothetical protein
VYDTTFALTLNKWYQIAVVYQTDNAKFTVYVVSENDPLRYQGFTSVREDVFAPGGLLGLGRFIPTIDALVAPKMTQPYVGLMDEVSVWQRIFQIAEIQSSFGLALSPKQPNLKGLWNMDEGDSNYVRSPFTDTNMYIQEYLWSKAKPTWLFSEAPIKLVLNQVDYNFDSTTLEAEAETFCNAVIKSTQIRTSCTGYTSNQLDTLVVMCKRQIALSSNIQSALMVLEGVSDSCMLKTQLSTWPAKALCTQFNEDYFPQWTGPACDKECHCGRYDASTTSQCSCK